MSQLEDFIRAFARSYTRARKKSTSPQRSSGKRTSRQKTRPASSPQRSSNNSSTPPLSNSYPGDYEGAFSHVYRPRLDGDPDPGEIVWTWVPYEEDFSQGKDRPVLLVGHDGPWLLGLMLTSKDHDRDAADEARWGRYWYDIGTGDWDHKGRPSEVRVDRVLRINPDGVRREGAILDKTRFTRVLREVRAVKGW